jgi:hypothetical protein
MEKGTYEVKRKYVIEACLLLSGVIIGGGVTIIGWLFFRDDMMKVPLLAAFSSIGVAGFFTLPLIMSVRNMTV